MRNINIIGNLTRDPEMRYTKNNQAVCTFNVAVNIKTGTEEFANFFRVSVFGVQGENASKYLTKGSKVAVSGSFMQREYVDRHGVPEKSLEITANDVEYLTQKTQQSGQANYTPSRMETPAGMTPVDDDYDELPF